MFEILWKSYSILVNLEINFQDEDGGISVRPMSSEEVKVPKYIPWSPFHILKVRLSLSRLSWLLAGPEEKGAPGAPAAGGGGQPEGRLPHLSRALRAWRAGSPLILVKNLRVVWGSPCQIIHWVLSKVGWARLQCLQTSRCPRGLRREVAGKVELS